MMEEELDTLFEGIRRQFRELRDALTHATAVEALKLVYLEVGRLPTAGEMLTCLAQLTARLNRLEQALRKKIEEVFAEELRRFVHEFWTDERAVKLSPPARDQLRTLLALDARSLSGLGQGFGMHSPLQKFDEFLLMSQVEGDQEFYREFAEARLAFTSTECAANTLATLRPLVEEAGLPSVIAKELFESLTPKPGVTPNAYEPISLIGEWRRGVAALIKGCELEKEPLEVRVGTPTDGPMTANVGSFNNAVNFIFYRSVKDDNSFGSGQCNQDECGAQVATLNLGTVRIRTKSERRIEDHLAIFEQWERDELGTTDPVSSHLFMMGDLLALREAPPYAEAMIRAFEALGIAPDQNAEDVLLRTGFHGYPAKYFLYPVPKRGYTLCVVLGHSYGDSDFVCAVRGSLDRAVAWVQSHSPITFEQQNVVVRAGPEVPRSAIVFIASGQETLQKHLSARKVVAEFIAAGTAAT